jgi:hypothetical protein
LEQRHTAEYNTIKQKRLKKNAIVFSQRYVLSNEQKGSDKQEATVTDGVHTPAKRSAESHTVPVISDSPGPGPTVKVYIYMPN